MQNYPLIVILFDGSQVTLRFIRSDDKEAILAFHARLSMESRFLYYHYSKGELTEKDLSDYCDLDQYNNLALVVEKQNGEHKHIIAVGRFYRLPCSITAEIAFAVQDSEQKKGLGTILLKHLARLAWERGIHYFSGEVLRQNRRMLSIFNKFDPFMQETANTRLTCQVRISIAEVLQRSVDKP